MNSLNSTRISQTLHALHQQADVADADFTRHMMEQLSAPGATVQAMIDKLIAEEKAGYGTVYHGHAEHFLSVSPTFGRFLYAMARARNATRIVEFGTSMGVSTIYLAAALRDNGGGQLTGSELETSKVARARANIEAAGLSDLVDIRQGDALETLKEVDGSIDILLLDGAFSLYLPVLRLLEPRLAPGSIILGENAFDGGYRDYVRDPDNGYLSQPLNIDEGRGNEFAIRL